MIKKIAFGIDVSLVNAHNYQVKLEDAVDSGTLGAVIEDEWQLASVPTIGNVQCELGSLHIADNTNETAALRHSNSFLGNWHQITRYESVDTELKKYTSISTTLELEEIELDRNKSTQLRFSCVCLDLVSH
eukprot:102391_1